MNKPDKWVILELGNGAEPIYKVFASWYGGYTGADSWRMNSGITRIEEDGDYLNFYGYSGSCYSCRKGSYGTNSYSQGILDNMINKAKEVYPDNNIEVMSEDTDWLNIEY